MSKPKRVADWPTYLLKDVPRTYRRFLTGRAAAQNVSVADVVRAMLCERYSLECPAESYGYDTSKDTGAPTILLRLQPKLARALDREAKRTGNSKRFIILETITSHYTKGEPS